MKKILLALSLSLVAVSSFARRCPDLSGDFMCPAYGSQPPSPMTVTQSTKDGVTTYVYRFKTGQVGKSSASPNGMIDAGMLKFCENDNLYLGEIGGKNPGRIQIHYIDFLGKYIVEAGGKVIQECLPKYW